eukprot:g7519.t1
MSTCESDLRSIGFFDGEKVLASVRIATTLVSITVTSAWFNWKKISRLSVFFAHWLAGLIAGLGYLVEDSMVTVCWTGSEVEDFVKAMKFVELSAINMFAITNLAICVNLALIISVLDDFIQISYFGVEFLVGMCMFVIVVWLVLFRMDEIKDCWTIHARIRFYFGLTLVGTAVNLGIGACGAVNLRAKHYIFILTVWMWAFRYIHVALDTVVLYGILRERNVTNEQSAGSGTNPGSGGSSNKIMPSARTPSV